MLCMRDTITAKEACVQARKSSAGTTKRPLCHASTTRLPCNRAKLRVCVCARVCLCVRVRVCVCPTRHQVRVRWRVRAWSKGCARMQACGSPAMCRACISEGVRTPFPTLHPPCVRLTHFLDHAPRMRKPALLLTPLPLSLRL